MNTQDIHAFMPRDYLTNCLKSDGEHLLEGFQSDSQDGEHGNEALKSDSQPANYDPISLLPPDAFLVVNPPNIPVLDFFRGAEAALLHVDPNTYRDLTYIKQRYVFFKAANGVGNVPKMSVNCKKGTRVVAINTWAEYVLYTSKQVDDLPTGNVKNTSVSTLTAVNSFNFFWKKVIVDVNAQNEFFDLKRSFHPEDVPIMCLASMNHPQRALSLAHYANKSTQIKNVSTSCSGASKFKYLNSIQRFLKCYETLYELTHIYDTDKWSWNTCPKYELVRKTLYHTTTHKESKIPAQVRDQHKLEYLSDHHFGVLNAFTFNRAQTFKDTMFPQYISIMQHWFMQLFMVYCCSRGGEELETLMCRELRTLSKDRILYEPQVDLKNTSLDSHYNLITKQNMEMVSKEAVDFLKVMVVKRYNDFHKKDRLFLIPSDEATPFSVVFFQRKPQGDHFCRGVVSTYANMLQTIDPTFPKGHFTNGSVRKCHTYILNMSLLPASVQMRSLGHKHSTGGNEYWRTTYNNPHDSLVREQVANAVHSKTSVPFRTTPQRQEPPVTRSQSGSGSKRARTLSLTSPDSTLPTKQPSAASVPSTAPPATYQSASIQFTVSENNSFTMQLPPGTVGNIVLPGGIPINFKVQHS